MPPECATQKCKQPASFFLVKEGYNGIATGCHSNVTSTTAALGVRQSNILTAGGGQSEIVGELLRSAARLSDRGEVPELQYLNASVSIALLRFAVQMAIATHKA
eukprot:c20787_g10_i6.p1 GENE.c20787_g10_i6~~c20787_g10_i6.p1  ORF type:complete len:104 (+),score=17.38 c20787_g10_i6:55-366(+)